MDFLDKSLFLTDSIKIAKSNSPFWYTSGTIGPYFINTHFLFGNEFYANELLNYIDKNKNDVINFLPNLTEKVIAFYNSNELFKNVIDNIIQKISNIKTFEDCDYISGGERRDWFFSPIIAHLTYKKLLYIYKDLKVFSNNGHEINNINGKKVCHVCDLITKASSQQRAWLPAINNISGKFIINISIVDRDEGGSNLLNQNGIKNYSCIIIDNDFLNKLLDNKIIDDNQLMHIKEFKKDPTKFGKDFLINNPDFLKKSLIDKINKQKAQRCIDENPYNLDFSKLCQN